LTVIGQFLTIQPPLLLVVDYKQHCWDRTDRSWFVTSLLLSFHNCLRVCTSINF